jgi:hypothetical protein
MFGPAQTSGRKLDFALFGEADLIRRFPGGVAIVRAEKPATSG